MSFGNPTLRKFYGEREMDKFFNSFHKCLSELVRLAKDKNFDTINFVGNVKTKNGLFMNVFDGLIVDGIRIEATLNRKHKKTFNVVCEDYYNFNRKLECFIKKDKFVWNTDGTCNLLQQRIFAEELMFAY